MIVLPSGGNDYADFWDDDAIPSPMHYSPGPPWDAECGAGFAARTNERERVTCPECLLLIAEPGAGSDLAK